MGRNRRCGFLAAQTNDLGHPSRASCMERFHISRFRWTACGKNAASPWEIPIHIDAKANYMKNIYSHLPRMPEKPTAVKQCDKTCRFRLRNTPFGILKQAVLQRQTAHTRNPLATSHLHKECLRQANAPFFFTKRQARSCAATARAGTKKGIPAREPLLSRFKECPISRDELPLTGKRQRKCHTPCRHRD